MSRRFSSRVWYQFEILGGIQKQKEQSKETPSLYIISLHQ
jgi:hypothetical protein